MWRDEGLLYSEPIRNEPCVHCIITRTWTLSHRIDMSGEGPPLVRPRAGQTVHSLRKLYGSLRDRRKHCSTAPPLRARLAHTWCRDDCDEGERSWVPGVVVGVSVWERLEEKRERS